MKQKTKSLGLSDLNQLQKVLKEQIKVETQAKAQTKQAKTELERLQTEFLQAVKDVQPIPQKNRFIHPPRAIPLPNLQQVKQEAFQEKQEKKHQERKKHDKLSDQFSGQHLRNDEMGTYLRKGIPDSLLKKLQKGFWPSAATLDLHGLTLEEARIATNAFLFKALNEQARCVTIVHGSGYNSPQGEAVLKPAVKDWLVQNSSILAFCPAVPAQQQDNSEAIQFSGAAWVLLHQEKFSTEQKKKKPQARHDPNGRNNSQHSNPKDARNASDPVKMATSVEADSTKHRANRGKSANMSTQENPAKQPDVRIKRSIKPSTNVGAKPCTLPIHPSDKLSDKLSDKPSSPAPTDNTPNTKTDSGPKN